VNKSQAGKHTIQNLAVNGGSSFLKFFVTLYILFCTHILGLEAMSSLFVGDDSCARLACTLQHADVCACMGGIVGSGLHRVHLKVRVFLIKNMFWREKFLDVYIA